MSIRIADLGLDQPYEVASGLTAPQLTSADKALQPVTLAPRTIQLHPRP